MPLNDASEPLLPPGTTGKFKFRNAVHKVPVHSHPRHNVSVTDFSDKDTVLLSCANYFVDENDEEVKVRILRLGSLQGSCSVEYETVDCSAEAGRRYKRVKGTLCFENGEFVKEVSITIIGSKRWEPVSEFRFLLSQAKDCEISSTLHQARVRIIDDDTFPSNYYAQFLDGEGGIQEGLEKSGVLRLVFAFVKLCFTSLDTIRWRSVLAAVFDQLQNVYLALTLYLQIYLVDVVFNNSPEAREHLLIHEGPSGGAVYTTFVVSALYLVPLIFLHGLALLKAYMNIGGRVQEFLQVSVFSRYMNYSKQSRAEVSAVHIEDAINHQGTEAAELYLQVLELLQIGGKVFVMGFFIVSENHTAALPLVIMPMAMLLWVFWHSRQIVEVREEYVHCEQDVRKFVHESAAAFGIISAYSQRHSTCEEFQTRSSDQATAYRKVSSMETHNEFFPKWLGAFAISVYLAWSAIHVESNQVTLGKVLATLRVFGELSEQMAEVFDLIMKIAGGVGPLQCLTEIINKESELAHRKELNAYSEKLSMEYYEKAVGQQVSPVSSFGALVANDEMQNAQAVRGQCYEDMPLQFSGVCFHHFTGDQDRLELEVASLSIPQGSLVSLIGAHGTGKATFCQLLARSTLPQTGHVFVPAQLKLLHVEQEEPILLQTSAWINLTFGSNAAQPSRVRKVLASLQMDATLHQLNKELSRLKIGRAQSMMNVARDGRIVEPPSCSEDGTPELNDLHKSVFAHAEAGHVESIEEDSKEAHWLHGITHSEKAKIHLARALIFNPDVLIVEKPFSHFGSKDKDAVMNALREFVDNRGYMLPPDCANLRRPRICVFTPCDRTYCKEADLVLHITRKLTEKGTVRQISHTEVDALHVDEFA